MPKAENFLELACRVVTLRLERGYLVKIYDVSSAELTKPLRRQLRENYDAKKVRNTYRHSCSGRADRLRQLRRSRDRGWSHPLASAAEVVGGARRQRPSARLRRGLNSRCQPRQMLRILALSHAAKIC